MSLAQFANSTCDSSLPLPSSNAEYKQKDYWDRRFEVEVTYDWFKSYESFRDQLLPELKPQDRILMVGCGNSTLSELLYKDGFHLITNIDFSQVVIDNMKQRCDPECPEMQWLCMDMLDMKFGDAQFDVVIEKGTIDALLVDQRDPWRPSRKLWEQMRQLLGHVARVLTGTGKFISITFAQPHFRRKRFNWDFGFVTFGEDFHYYIYIMNKQGSGAAPSSGRTGGRNGRAGKSSSSRVKAAAQGIASDSYVAPEQLVHASGVALKHLSAAQGFSSESDDDDHDHNQADKAGKSAAHARDDPAAEEEFYEDLERFTESEHEDFWTSIDVDE